VVDSECCIYCGNVIDGARGEGDHIIPVQLGEFRGDVRFRRICTSCNNAIGRSEQQFLRCGPESFLRDVVNPRVPHRRQRGRSPAKRVMGAPGPESTISRGDHNQLVFRCEDNPTNIFPVDQLVIHDDKDQEHFVQLFPNMRPEQLLERVKKAGVNVINRAWVHCEEDHLFRFRCLVVAAWPQHPIQELSVTDAGVHPVAGQITVTVTDHYFRAIAKIAFHYYLSRCQRGLRGDERCFEPIRSFIMTGGDSDRFFGKSHIEFAIPCGDLPTGGVVTPRQWCHVMAADESASVVVIHLQFFVGPGCVPPPWYVTLGDIGSPLVVPDLTWGHVYLYDDPPLPGGYAGFVQQAQISRLR
jgi:hypothetical protein